MATRIDLAVAPDRKICRVGKRSKKVEGAACVWIRHLGSEFLGERSPCAIALRLQPELHGLKRWRKVWKPKIVPVVGREAFLWNTTRGTTNGAEPKAFVGYSWTAKADDAKGHALHRRTGSIALARDGRRSLR